MVTYLVELVLLPIELVSGLAIGTGYSYALLEATVSELGARVTVSRRTSIVHISA